MSKSNIELMLLVSFSVLAVGFIPTALAQSASDIDHTQDMILGFSPILIALAITVTGVLLRIFQGLVKRRQAADGSAKIDPMQITSSFIISFFASLPIVGTALHNIPYDISDLNLFVMLVGMIATVMGIDAGVKAGIQKMQKPVAAAAAPATITPASSVPPPEPDERDEVLPPGKSHDIPAYVGAA